MIQDLCGLPVSNSSLLDESTAAAEAVALIRRATPRLTGPFVLDADALPQTIAVIQTRTEAMGIPTLVHDLRQGLPEGPIAGLLVQYPGANGQLWDPSNVVEEAHSRGALAALASDLLALTQVKPPGELGADIAIGSSQRFGVPLFYGGPHAGYLATTKGLERHLPGRLVGVSVDAEGRPAYRLALQTREQHIRRDKATSNICTAQVLLAVAAGMYAVYHGPDGLRAIGRRVHQMAADLASSLQQGGYELVHEDFFDTVLVRVSGDAQRVVAQCREQGIHVRLVDRGTVGLATSELTTPHSIELLCRVFGVPVSTTTNSFMPSDLCRSSPYLQHPVFAQHRSETSMLRYLRALSARDYALDRGMIPLGSCTMKLNATTEMEPIGFPGFADLHPLVPAPDAEGYRQLITQLELWLAEITGYDRVSVQPNAGSQGELAGLLAIAKFHASRGEKHRTVCLIPASAHGTNAASAVMAGMRVVVVKSAEDGSVDLADLTEKCVQHQENLAAIMVTYPSTHGVYEESIVEIADLVHNAGGQVYIDGANLNALLGYAKPGWFGGDVSHLNLHKTFCIPHGGGGPGVGPVAVRNHLAPFLPTHGAHPDPALREGLGPVSAAPFGSAGILPISWAYIRLMGAEGLTRATACAVLAANYIAKRLNAYFPVLYRGAKGLVAHECILDLRPLTKETGVTAEDVAKRLIDYGFHAPTMSFPVAGTLMVEPTESENLDEIDRFCAAMMGIHAEIMRVQKKECTVEQSPLRNAPHTAKSLMGEWAHPYSREDAVFPAGYHPDKYWPPVARIDQAYGDRNLVCSCPPPEAFVDSSESELESHIRPSNALAHV
jgi:glycine dehydrogenase